MVKARNVGQAFHIGGHVETCPHDHHLGGENRMIASWRNQRKAERNGKAEKAKIRSMSNLW
jgi:hypothetical protein